MTEFLATRRLLQGESYERTTFHSFFNNAESGGG